MPINNNTTSKAKRNLTTVSSGKSGRKAPGTRLGMLDDWREGSTKSGKLTVRYGHTLRDGR